MNTEELEMSLRTEFEQQIKDVVAKMRRDVSDFKKTLDAEFEKHRAQTDEAFRSLLSRLESDPQFDEMFVGSVTEHLRLARDEGAQLAATAFGEAEKLKDDEGTPADHSALRDAVNAISRETTQASILKVLVQHAASFAPRGAFFIAKGEQLVGWKAFGDEAEMEDHLVGEIRIPMTADTLLAHAVNEVETRGGAYGQFADDQDYLAPLDFGTPDRMCAIPLMARGRGVAVMYADYGTRGARLDVEALETLVRVAGLTVELLAASQTARAAAIEQATGQAEQVPHADEAVQPQSVPVYDVPSEPLAEPEYHEQSETAAEPEYPVPSEPVTDLQEVETAPEHELAGSVGDVEVIEYEPEELVSSEAQSYEFVTDERPTVEAEYGGNGHAAAFEPVPAVAAPEVVFEEAAVQPEATTVEADVADKPISPGLDSLPSTAFQPDPGFVSRPRLSERAVDLPIEVDEDERKPHNEARRFARLLVSEIKLYNEQKVTEGREAGDLYDRLRDAIDRSREMYDKRVQPAVAAKFDYFDYELVGSLAEGEKAKLGPNYGVSV
ncbi:MAG: hypothetical protein H0V76_06510 [Blastocatellia bacterium]|nr:hypothetical protein [Blastocatellia bacterium]